MTNKDLNSNRRTRDRKSIYSVLATKDSLHSLQYLVQSLQDQKRYFVRWIDRDSISFPSLPSQVGSIQPSDLRNGNEAKAFSQSVISLLRCTIFSILATRSRDHSRTNKELGQHVCTGSGFTFIAGADPDPAKKKTSVPVLSSSQVTRRRARFYRWMWLQMGWLGWEDTHWTAIKETALWHSNSTSSCCCWNQMVFTWSNWYCRVHF